MAGMLGQWKFWVTLFLVVILAMWAGHFIAKKA